MPAYVSDEVVMEAVRALEEANGNYAEAARKIGRARSTIQDQIKIATKRNLTGIAWGGPTPPSHELGKITQEYIDPVTKRREWRRLVPVKEQVESLIDAFKEYLAKEVTPLKVIDAPLVTLGNKLTIYPIPDFHFGQLSWGKETGESWDMNIARETMMTSSAALMAKGPATEHAWVVFLGDYFHADDETNMTKRSHNTLDVDGRNSKVTMMGAEIAVQRVDMALQKHRYVTVKALPGNHDPKSGGDLLTLALMMRYGDNPRVTIDITPGVFWFKEFGTTMTGWHHGHTVKPENMPATMSAYEPEMWGRTKYRYAYLGHFHRRIRGRDQDSHSGAIWEVFQAITARDAWNRSMGHNSGRSMVAIVIDRDDGEESRYYQPI